MVQQIWDLSKVDSVTQGDSYENIGSPLRVPVGDPLGRQHVLEAPMIGTTNFLRDSNSNISTMVTLMEGGRYFIEIITRDSASLISTIATTTSYSTSYV